MVCGGWVRMVRMVNGGEMYLVRRWVIREANVAVDAKVDVLEGQLRDGGVRGDDLIGQGGDVGLPVF